MRLRSVQDIINTPLEAVQVAEKDFTEAGMIVWGLRGGLKWSLFGLGQAHEVRRIIEAHPSYSGRLPAAIDPIAGYGVDGEVMRQAGFDRVHLGDLKGSALIEGLPVVEARSIDTLRRHNGPDTILMLIWQHSIDAGVLEEFAGRYVLWVGEDSGGCTYGYQPKDFMAKDEDGRLDRDAEAPWIAHPIPMPRHSFINDFCVLYERRPVPHWYERRPSRHWGDADLGALFEHGGAAAEEAAAE
jgi:hypothetical protein